MSSVSYFRRPLHDIPQSGIIRRRAKSHPRRSQFAGARLSLGGRHAAVFRARQRLPHVGCGRQGVHRLCRFMGPVNPRPRASGGDRGCATGGDAGLEFRRANRGRGRAGRTLMRARTRARASAACQLGDRSDDERDTARARLHGTRRHRQVRRLLSRSRRCAAGQGWLRRADVRQSKFGRRAGGNGCPHAGARIQQRGNAGSRVCARRRQARLRHRRTGGRKHERGDAGRRVSRYAACAVHASWRAIDIRRSDDRLSRRPVRCAGPVRHHRRPDNAG